MDVCVTDVNDFYRMTGFFSTFFEIIYEDAC